MIFDFDLDELPPLEVRPGDNQPCTAGGSDCSNSHNYDDDDVVVHDGEPNLIPEEIEEENAEETSVNFKCIGVTRERSRQDTLHQVAIKFGRTCEQLRHVPVRVIHEPDNPVDAQALAFQCQLDGVWHCIGYVVKEALDAVHDAIKKNQIVSVKFQWIKFLLCFPRSGPGYYASINITRLGQWPYEVIIASSS